MKILIIARPDLFTKRGGDTIQIKNTVAELKKFGVQIDIHTGRNLPDYDKYDLLHLFNIIDCEDLLIHSLNSKKPYVVSTIYVNYEEYDKNHRTDMIGKLSKFFSYNTIEYLKTLVKFLFRNEKISTSKYFFMGHKGSIKYIVKKAALLLPNSENEYKRLQKDYCISQKHMIVPNGINPTLFTLPKSHVEREIVLCVARFEGRKNQLNLIKAMKNTNIETILIGPISVNQKKYYADCLLEATENIKILSQVSQYELLNYYAMAKVHVLPSWFETTGLSSLEAAAMQCNLVVGDRGDVREYFGNYVSYCDPGNVSSIKAAIMTEWEKPFNTKLSEMVLSNYTWEKAAKVTHNAYNVVLKESEK